MSGTAKVTVNEIDKTQRVSGQSSAFVAGVIPAVRGPLEPLLVSTNNDFYANYTPENKYKSGYDSSYIEVEKFLNDASSLYLNRAYTNPKLSAAQIFANSSSKNNASIQYPIFNENDFVFTTNNGRPYIGDSLITVISASNSIQVSALFYGKCITGDKIRFTKDVADSFPPEILENTDYFLVKSSTLNTIYICSSKANAIATNPIILTITDNGLGTSLKVSNIEVSLIASVDQPLILIHSADQGVWGNLLEIKTINYASNTTLVKEPNCFYLEVFYKGVSTGESFICSFDRDKTDKFGSSLFIEEVLKSSNYIRAKVNPIVDTTFTIKENSSVYLGLDNGSDGTAITESELIAALQPYRNTKKYSIQFICDFGITLPAFQKEIISICEARGDCAFILSVPYSTQVSNTYLQSILNYKNTVLNSVSNYGAIYAGHVKVQDSQLGRQLWISPSGFVAAKAVKVWDSGTPWSIIANTLAELTVLDVARHFEEPEESVLVDNGINPIRFEYGGGIKVWGERTLQIVPTAFDRLHTRLLFNFIKPAMKAALTPFLFTLNNLEDPESTMSTIVDVLSSYLDTIKGLGGIYGYSVVCDLTNNSKNDIVNSRLNVAVYISPVYGVEQIRLDLTANNNFIAFNS